MTTACVKCTVSGRVQGVFYRAATEQQASALGLDGWVRNCPDGQVELVVRGEAAAVERLVRWLWDGPPAAQVERVVLDEYEDAVEAGFSIRR